MPTTSYGKTVMIAALLMGILLQFVPLFAESPTDAKPTSPAAPPFSWLKDKPLPGLHMVDLQNNQDIGSDLKYDANIPDQATTVNGGKSAIGHISMNSNAATK